MRDIGGVEHPSPTATGHPGGKVDRPRTGATRAPRAAGNEEALVSSPCKRRKPVLSCKNIIRREGMFSQRVLRFALLAVVSALVLPAQTGSGTVQGVVKDATSAGIASARVTMVNAATMAKFSTST